MVGLAAAAGGVGALLKALQHMETMMGMMQTLVEKCTYMEQRMDKGAGKLSDCCRHLQQTFEAFEVSLNPGGSLKQKWWWVSRRVRNIYEDFTGALMQKGLEFKSVSGAWSLVCLEVYMRCCRDLAAMRHAALEHEDIDEEQMKALENALKNYGDAGENCAIWSPLEVELLEGFEPSSGVELVLKHQVMERIDELKSYAYQQNQMKLFEGMNLRAVGI